MRAIVLAGLLSAACWSSNVLAADLARGELLYKRFCGGCHGPDGQGGAHTFMPHVENLTKRGYIELLPDDYLLAVIRDGGPSVGKSSYMPAWGGTIADEDIVNIVAHIRSLAVR